jgi:phosphoribosylaminoimidazolecarboxamide formyltransferase/IMP cyclohydrolase
MIRTKHALISVASKEGIVEFARSLIEMSWHITASPGTARKLTEAGLPVTDMVDITQIPAILDHRVFSEHIKIAGALVAEASESHDEDRAAFDIPWYDLLVVDLYPLSAAIAEGKNEQDVIEATDIGGVTLIRNAVKGRRIVVTDPQDRGAVAEQLRAQGDIPVEERRSLWAKAELYCARYCLESARYISQGDVDGLLGERRLTLRYGENPYQSDAAFFACDEDDPLSIARFELLSGSPGYVNTTSLDALTTILARLSSAYAANFEGKTLYIAIGAKHGIPVGAAVDWDSPETALKKMFWGDPKVIWGGEVIVNFPISGNWVDLLIADPRREELYGSAAWMLDLVAAPAYDADSLERLSARKRRCVFANPALEAPALSAPYAYRNLQGGFIRQNTPAYALDKADISWTGEPLASTALDTLILVWGIAWSIHANGIALARDRQLLACDGQSSSIGAVQTTLLKAKEAGHHLEDALFAANAFLPFTDSAELLAAEGCVGGIVPTGGKNEGDVMDTFTGQGMSIARLPAQYRGFARH